MFTDTFNNAPHGTHRLPTKYTPSHHPWKIKFHQNPSIYQKIHSSNELNEWHSFRYKHNITHK